MQYPDFIFYLCIKRKNLHVMSFSSTDEYQKFETLFKQYYSGLVVYASRFTGNTENAEDLVHDLFIHIWEDNRILGTDHIKAYLFTSIRHRCLNYLDHLKIRNEYQEKILQKRDITGMLTWEYYVEAELRQHIETAIDHLPPQARKIFLMNRFDRKTAVTIASELGLSPRTVEKHLEVALKNLKKELKDVERHRELIRGQRKQSGLKVAALVGYTSAGKSSIENALTQAGVLEDAMLFSTLDTTTRALTLDNTQEILLTDTVGFINKLPHHLVEAFKSTLEEAKYADIIVHVVDASNPQMDAQMHVVYETLRQLGAEGKPVITLFNKQDKVENPVNHKDLQADYSIATSAKTGQGLEEFKHALLEIIRKEQIYIERLYDFSEAGKIQLIRSKGQLLSEEYVPEGIEVKAYVPQDIYGRL